MNNLFSNLPTKNLPNELFETLQAGKQFKLERIISTGQTTPENQWYDQAQTEWVVLLKGQARLLFEDNNEVTLTPGDHLLIPAHTKHRVSWTTPNETCIWLALHFDE